jgi:branched-chain amino acid transport system permease protein
VIFQRVAYYPLRHRSYLPVVISTIGASILLQNGALVVFEAQPFRPVSPFQPGQVLELGATRIVPQYILIIVATLALVAFQYWLFERTIIGKQFQATAQDQQTARLMGIRVDRMIVYTFMYSAVLGGIAGLLISPLLLVYPTMGGSISLKAFSASIVGGFGSVPGAIVGGLVLGIAEKFGARYISSEYEQAIAFVILIAVLLFRPQGLFGEKISEKA